jgi:hypothetical protein
MFLGAFASIDLSYMVKLYSVGICYSYLERLSEGGFADCRTMPLDIGLMSFLEVLGCFCNPN